MRPTQAAPPVQAATAADARTSVGATGSPLPRVGIATGDHLLARRMLRELRGTARLVWACDSADEAILNARHLDVDVVLIGPGTILSDDAEEQGAELVGKELTFIEQLLCESDAAAVTVALPWVTSTVTPALLDSGISAVCKDVADIAGRVAEAHSGRKRRMAAVVAAAAHLGDLERGVAQMLHDVRAPLSAVLSGMELLSSPQMREADRAAMHEAVTGQLRGLLDDAEDFLRFAASGDEPRTTLDLDAVLAGLAARTRLAITQSGVKDIVVPGVIVEHVLMNLLANAERHGGSSISSVHVHAEVTATEVIITVDDDGSGLGDNPERLFAGRLPTGRLHHGLPWSRVMARRNGGDVTAGEAPSGGARFVLRVAARRLELIDIG